jgi:hypothetical protein
MNGMAMTAAICVSNRKRSDQVGWSARRLFSTSWRILEPGNTPVILSPCQTNANNMHWSPQTNGQVTSALGPCLNVFGGVASLGLR